MQRQGGETSQADQREGVAMEDLSVSSLGRGSCCMLCSNQLYSAGFNIYQARTYHGEKSFYDKLIQLTNYTASLPQLTSDCLCSVCATLLSQIDQLEFQLSHLVSQIRSLFHKMVQAQSEAAAPQGQPPPTQQLALPQPGLPGGSARALSSELTPVAGAYAAEVKTEPPSTDQPQAGSYFAKKPAKENGDPSSATAVGVAEPARRPSWPAAIPAAPTSNSGGSTDDGVFNIGHFLDPAAASTAGDFTDKFVREVASEDAYRFQCVLCSRLADCAEAIRQHVRRDHAGADRISFPGSAAAGKRGQPRSAPGAAGKSAPALGAGSCSKVPRSITASAAAMAQSIAERAFVCAGCDKAFGCEAFLTRHVAAQHCGRMFGCQYCGKEFSRSDKKVRHERSHTGERPFSCGFCGKAFSRRDKCTYHERSHTRHRPLECERCGEVMFTTAAYATHRQRCTDDAQGTGSLWQTQPAPTAQTAQTAPTAPTASTALTAHTVQMALTAPAAPATAADGGDA